MGPARKPAGTGTEEHLALQVDVYSLGVIMCQLFSGATPYAGMGMPAVLFAVVHKKQRPDVPADMPPDYRDLMQRCWDNDMRNRCRDAAERRASCVDHPAMHSLLAVAFPSLQVSALTSFRTDLGKQRVAQSSSQAACHMAPRPTFASRVSAAGRQWRRSSGS